jgi:hypothetical protein
VASYACLFVLQQSHTLWSRPVPLPRGEDGPFGAFRRLFHPGWLSASRELDIGFANAVLYILLLGWIFGVYLFALKKLYTSRHPRPGSNVKRALFSVLGVTALSLAILVVLPGTFSTDMHSYVWYGRIFAIYGDNPFLHVPGEYAGRDPGGWLEFVYWKDVPSVYGPVWVWLAGGIAFAAEWVGGGIGTHLTGHRLLAAAAHLANAAMIWHVAGLLLERYGDLLRRHAAPQSSTVERHRNEQVAVAMAYAWSPLALIEFGANGHNDVLIVTGLLACLWLHLTGRWRLAVLALAAATLVKASALIWLPGYLWLLLWEVHPGESRSGSGIAARLSRAGQAAAVTACAWGIAYLPFWEGPATIQPLAGGPAATRMINSLGQLAYLKLPDGVQYLRALFGWEPMDGAEMARFAGAIFDPIRWTAVVTALAAVMVVTWRARDLMGTLRAWGWGGFAYLTVGAVWFWPWYVSWLLVPVALLGWGRLMLAVQILSACSLTLYAVYPDVPQALGELPRWRALILVAPALLYSLSSLALLKVRRGSLPRPVSIRGTAVRSDSAV